ncbi:hypothetical protein K5M76_17880 [Shewanella xiamenensis]|uniref:hypothetical protein n=1 Tax=Shewanella TaxID=22 RepID=UPI000B51CFDB|nr:MULTISPECIES: hypothetical protein [Shewanella]ASF17037.1 hypothetical protein CEQ32_19860 [Shewanella sp. FDAARGOS_354]MCT8859476.1 hypothetical protein [Shewanella xiamenensis]MDN5501664.1 hypothetical protein [Shewanella sp.]MDN5529545.1 hypothetical protein [Shewanella sp.]UWG64036.1 hypothetical protein K5M76_17880 [Shewanella xiamenensis]
MKPTVIILLSFFLASCASNDGRHNETLSGLATVSALLVAVPLVPFAEAYHIINDTEGKNRERARLLAEKYDPVYNERISIIEQRSAESDARNLINAGVVALLPSVPGVKIYPGLLPKQSEQIDHSSNSKSIEANELLAYLSSLMDQDPSHKQAGPYYFGEPYKKFISTGWAYKEAFNHIMLQQLNISKSSNRVAGGI